MDLLPSPSVLQTLLLLLNASSITSVDHGVRKLLVTVKLQEDTLKDLCASNLALASQGGTSRYLLAVFQNISSGLQTYGHDVLVGPDS